MKKLMCAVAAIAAGVVFADITSSNVVGYQGFEIGTDFTWFTPTFGGMTDEYSIQDIKLIGFSGYGEEDIQVLDENGTTVETYFYYNEETAQGIDPSFKEGWYDESGAWATRTFKKGEGFLIENQNDTETVQFAGQVISAPCPIEVGTDFTFLGNMTPVGKGIQLIALTDFSGYGEEDIQILDENGTTIETYFYYNEETAQGIDPSFKEGWYDESAAWATRVFKPGEAFIFENQNDVETITLPGVEL